MDSYAGFQFFHLLLNGIHHFGILHVLQASLTEGTDEVGLARLVENEPGTSLSAGIEDILLLVNQPLIQFTKQPLCFRFQGLFKVLRA